MTVKFFPVFFQQECHITPVALNVVFACLDFIGTFASILAQRISKRLGRLEVVIPGAIISVVCTFLMGVLKPFYTDTWLMIPLFVAIFTFMGCTGGIEASITADYTPKSQVSIPKSLNKIMDVYGAQ